MMSMYYPAGLQKTITDLADYSNKLAPGSSLLGKAQKTTKPPKTKINAFEEVESDFFNDRESVKISQIPSEEEEEDMETSKPLSHRFGPDKQMDVENAYCEDINAN